MADVDNDELAKAALLAQGGAQALALAAAGILEPHDPTSDDLSTASDLLYQAAKLCDRAALKMRRMAEEHEGGGDGE